MQDRQKKKRVVLAETQVCFFKPYEYIVPESMLLSLLISSYYKRDTAHAMFLFESILIELIDRKGKFFKRVFHSWQWRIIKVFAYSFQ